VGGERKLAKILRSHDIHVLASCCYSDRDDSVVLLVPSDPVQAQLALEQAGFSCKANSVLLIRAPDRGGIALCMFQIGGQLREAGVEILYSYASKTDDGEVYAVFKTADDDDAMRALEPSIVAPVFQLPEAQGVAAA
jgi:hypothetical protein